MLILTRRAGESIRLFDNVLITILDQKGSQVRIGFEAPYEIPIYREEVYQDIISGNIREDCAHKHHVKPK